ncbi:MULTISPECIES: 3'(2'),5'-bisphosphate nucleotidase CysQ family protein [unclassified Helicobacter]|uniref:3'(2'),5'-bisphosphate nucleotidase CysQ family protein n=1 Tax=unclassified Helicobacter TaxID=2593540 RepID=UPI000CF111C2|nr:MULTISPECIES: 3'(2'),5'-bisphosphate nucleotidase CysQ [unclassified Helicobacter]
MIEEKLLFQVVEVAIKAGREIMSFYGSNVFEYKEDLSPVTQADKVANEVIIKELGKFSHDPICSEESILPYEKRSQLESYWLVDPLDGTKDFLAQNGSFAVNIALIHHNRPILGVIYAPSKDIAYIGLKQYGAYKIKECQKKNIERLQNTKIALPEAMDLKFIACGSIHHDSQDTKDFFQYYGLEMLKIGSALKFCALAEGSADLYPRFVGTKEWDVAAGDIILQEAGGMILDATTKQPLEYNKKSLKNNNFIAFGKRVLDGNEELLERIYTDFKGNLGFFC